MSDTKLVTGINRGWMGVLADGNDVRLPRIQHI